MQVICKVPIQAPKRAAKTLKAKISFFVHKSHFLQIMLIVEQQFRLYFRILFIPPRSICIMKIATVISTRRKTQLTRTTRKHSTEFRLPLTESKTTPRN